MRISELSRRSGVLVATIKYYLREGLMAGGEKSSTNQADYDDAHLARLRLIRALLEVGGLSIAGVRAVLGAIDDEDLPFGHAVGIAAHALPDAVPASADAGTATLGRLRVERLVAERGWHVSAENSGFAVAARVLDDYVGLGRSDLTTTLDSYAEAAELVARVDIESVAAAPTRALMTETVVIGTVLGDALLSGLRRMAHEDAAVRRFPVDPPPTTTPQKEAL
jgi:DNA-binding transcriptional MerR regulator